MYTLETSCAEETFRAAARDSRFSGEVHTLETSCAEETFWGSLGISGSFPGAPRKLPPRGDHFTETFWSKTVFFKGKTVQNRLLGSFQNTHFASCAEETFWGWGQISWNSGEVYTLETSCAEETFWAAGQISLNPGEVCTLETSCAEETFRAAAKNSRFSGEVCTLETSCAEEIFWSSLGISGSFPGAPRKLPPRGGPLHRDVF